MIFLFIPSSVDGQLDFPLLLLFIVIEVIDSLLSVVVLCVCLLIFLKI